MQDREDSVVAPQRRVMGVERLATVAVLVASILFTLWVVWQGVDFAWRLNAFINNINQRVVTLEGQRGVNPSTPSAPPR